MLEAYLCVEFFFILLWQRFVQHEYLLKLFKLLNIFYSAPSLIFLQFVLFLSALEQECNFVKIQTLFHEKKITHEHLSKQWCVLGYFFFVLFVSLRSLISDHAQQKQLCFFMYLVHITSLIYSVELAVFYLRICTTFH